MSIFMFVFSFALLAELAIQLRLGQILRGETIGLKYRTIVKDQYQGLIGVKLEMAHSTFRCNSGRARTGGRSGQEIA